METGMERAYRRTLPSSWPRAAAMLSATLLVNYLHTFVRMKIIHAIIAHTGSVFLGELYLQLSTAMVLAPVPISAFWLVICYYYVLRERRLHTSLSELGLAVRGTFAGLAAFGIIIFAFAINDRGL